MFNFMSFRDNQPEERYVYVLEIVVALFGEEFNCLKKFKKAISDIHDEIYVKCENDGREISCIKQLNDAQVKDFHAKYDAQFITIIEHIIRELTKYNERIDNYPRPVHIKHILDSVNGIPDSKKS